MYFKRISDLHPLDAKTLITGSDSHDRPVSKSQYYDLDTLWVEVAQTVITSDNEWTPISSSPTYVDNIVIDDDGNRQAATNHETLSATDAYVSRKCSLAEVLKNVGDINTTYITAQFADLSFITSYYIQGKQGDDHNLYFNIPNADQITSISSLAKTPMVHLHGAELTGSHSTDYDATIAAAQHATMTVDTYGITAKQAHCEYQFSTDYRAKTDSDVGTGISANCTGLTASNIVVPGEATLTAAAAYWADLAELYSADTAYPVGTLVKFGGEAEITIADDQVNAVVTEKPAYLMNTALRETVAYPTGLVLTGRSKVRVVGPIHKFDRLGLATTTGTACKVWNADTIIIGIALETNLAESEKLVEATLKLTF